MTYNKNEIAIWWLNESDCEVIGEPHSYYADIDYWKERNIVSFSATDKDIYWIDFGAMPGYVSREYTSRYGRAGRGRLWVNSFVFKEPVNVSDYFEKSAFTQSLEDYGGIVILKKDISILKGFKVGIFTDLELNKIDANDTQKDELSYTCYLERHYNSKHELYMKIVVYVITNNQSPILNRVKIVNGVAGQPNTFSVYGNFDADSIPVLNQILRKTNVWLNSHSDSWEIIARADNMRIIDIGNI